MNGDNEDQMMFVTNVRDAVRKASIAKVSCAAMVGYMRGEVAWLEIQMTRAMNVELDRIAAEKKL